MTTKQAEELLVAMREMQTDICYSVDIYYDGFANPSGRFVVKVTGMDMEEILDKHGDVVGHTKPSCKHFRTMSIHDSLKLAHQYVRETFNKENTPSSVSP